jgi:pre-mRNA-splicing factor SYF1
MYLSIFDHPSCPPILSHSHARRTYDRALRTLPPSLHHRIWVRYLLWAEARGGLTTVAVYRRYLVIDPSVTERYVALLLSPSNPSPRPLEAAKLLLQLSRKAARGEYISAEGKSPYQLLGDWLDVVEAHAEEVGIGAEELASIKSTEDTVNTGTNGLQMQQNGNSLIRLAGPPTAVGADGKPMPVYDEDEDPNSTRKLDIEKIVREDGLAVYKDQAGRLWTGLATYWIKRGEFDRAKATFETGIATVLTIRDFTQIFDAYAEFSESVISALMEELADPDEEDEDFDAKEREEELDAKMKECEELIDRRPFLVNDVLLRRNPNDVQEWEKRVALWGQNDEKVRYIAFSPCFQYSLMPFGRSQKLIHRRSPLLLRVEPQRTSIACISTLPSFTKKAGQQAKRRRTSLVPAKFSKRLPRSTSRVSKTLLRFGVNGLRWKYAMSKMCPHLAVKTT